MLTGKMAGAYLEGMQGDDPKYLRCASTLKHFYGNNTEVGRGWKNSSIDPRNKYELYLEPFRRCIEESGGGGGGGGGTPAESAGGPGGQKKGAGGG